MIPPATPGHMSPTPAHPQPGSSTMSDTAACLHALTSAAVGGSSQGAQAMAPLRLTLSLYDHPSSTSTPSHGGPSPPTTSKPSGSDSCGVSMKTGSDDGRSSCCGSTSDGSINSSSCGNAGRHRSEGWSKSGAHAHTRLISSQPGETPSALKAAPAMREGVYHLLVFQPSDHHVAALCVHVPAS